MTSQVVRPRDEDTRDAHIQKNATRGHTMEKKNMTAKPNMERCV